MIPKMASPDSDSIPEEIRTILDDEEFSETRKHSRWYYVRAFVAKGADTFQRSLTRRDVEQWLEQHYNDLCFANTRSTSHEALQDLVEVDILEVDKKGTGHRYWVTHSLNTAERQASDTAGSPSDGRAQSTERDTSSPSTASTGPAEATAAQSTERDASSPSTASTGPAEATAAQSTERDASSPSTASTGPAEATAAQSTAGVAWDPSSQILGVGSLFALVAGLFLTIVALVFLRLPIATAPWIESAALAWALISIGVAAGGVTVAQWLDQNLGTPENIGNEGG
jgi:cobalamin biosynthesis Mg chelatase CobN